jgi:hypothetical protein
MITDHTKTSSELKGMVSGDMKAAIPTALDDSSQKKLDKLKDSKPEDFASEYDHMQVSAHKDATSLFERYAKGGDGPKLKDWGGQDAPGSAAPPRNGARHEQEPQIGTNSRPRAAIFFSCRVTGPAFLLLPAAGLFPFPIS